MNKLIIPIEHVDAIFVYNNKELSSNELKQILDGHFGNTNTSHNDDANFSLDDNNGDNQSTQTIPFVQPNGSNQQSNVIPSNHQKTIIIDKPAPSMSINNIVKFMSSLIPLGLTLETVVNNSTPTLYVKSLKMSNFTGSVSFMINENEYTLMNPVIDNGVPKYEFLMTNNNDNATFNISLEIRENNEKQYVSL